MNCIPLPDELVRKVYGFIHPMFDYVAYVKALRCYDDEEDTFDNIYDRRNNIVSVDDKIEYNDIIIAYAFLMNNYLCVIRDFIKGNPMFERPGWDEGQFLTEDLYKWKGESGFSNKQVARMEKNIYKRRSKVAESSCCAFDDDEYCTDYLKPVLLYHDIVFILKHGSLATIIYHCRMNNIGVIDDPGEELSRLDAGWANDDVYKKYLVGQLIAL